MRNRIALGILRVQAGMPIALIGLKNGSMKGRTDMDTRMIDNQEKKLSKEYSTEIPNEMIESQTKKVPNLVFLGLGLASMGISAFFAWKSKKTDPATFIGQWVPTLLLFGLYNKLVKVEDEILDQTHSRRLH